MSKIDLILQAIKAGVSAPKIIAKYGKKLYKKVKAEMKETDRVDIANKEWIKTNTLLKGSIPLAVALPSIEPIQKHLTKKGAVCYLPCIHVSGREAGGKQWTQLIQQTSTTRIQDALQTSSSAI